MNRVEFIATAESLQPEVGQRVEDAERCRRLPEESFKSLVETGLLRGLQPREYGGFEIDPLTFFEAQMALAEECASTAWVLGIVGIHNWHLSLFPERAIEDVWGEDPSTQISSALAPTGSADVVDGGFMLHGSWPFSSGSDHCDWAVVGALFTAATGDLKAGAFLIPRSDYRIDDVWRTLGLRGTGSNTIVVDEPVFVPAHRFHSQTEQFVDGELDVDYVPKSVSSGPMVRMPFGCVFSSAVAAPAVGVARGALRRFVDDATRRRSNVDFSRASESNTVARRISQAESDIEAAHHAFVRNWTAIQDLAEAGCSVPLDVRARTRSEIAVAVQRCVDAVESLFEVAGSGAVFDSSPIQRSLRDVLTIRAHFSADAERAVPLRGRALVGTLRGRPQDFL